MPIYEYECRWCAKRFEHYSPLPHDIMTEHCPRCGDLGDRVFSLAAAKVFQTFETRNILPGGAPVTVKGPGQLRQLEAEHHVRMMDADAPPPQTIPTIGGGD
jgi:putative FmdB family regulatory protein